MLRILALTLPLALDTFAVSAALGISGRAQGRSLRISVLFCAFEALMPLIGLALGAPLGHTIGAAADYVAVAVLIALGGYLVVGEGGEGERVTGLLEGRGFGLLVLGLSVSLDELAIGFAFGLLRLPIVPALIVIAAQAFVAAQLGLRLGARVGERIREASERVAGLALMALGLGLLAAKLIG
jgi:manganese efflux pump family protein